MVPHVRAPLLRVNVGPYLVSVGQYLKVVLDALDYTLFLGQVDIPSTVYNGQIPVAPVSTGRIPIHPQGVFGPMETREINPKPIRTRITRSIGCSVTTRKFLIKPPVER